MTQKKLLKNFLLLGGLSTAFAPIAIAASCGESSSSATTKTASTTFISNTKANLASSLHNAVKWSVASDPSIAKVQYLYTTTAQDITAVKTLDAQKWTDELPKEVNFESASRYLWAKLTPASSYELTDNFIDITKSSQIGLIRSDLNTFPEITNFNFDIKVATNLSGPYALDEAPVAPDKAVLVYDIPNKQGASYNELQALIMTRPTTIELNAISAYLKPIDETKYAISNPKTKKLIVSEMIALSEAEKTELEKIKAITRDSDFSTHNAATWEPKPPKPTRITNITYLSGEYPTEGAVKNAPETSWKKELPTSVDYRPTRRNLWARVEAASGFFFQNPYIDLTTSSRIQRIPTLIEAIDPVSYAKIDLTKVVVGGTLSNLTLTIPSSAGFNLPPYLAMAISATDVYLNSQNGMATISAPSLADFQENYNNYGVVFSNESINNLTVGLVYVPQEIDEHTTYDNSLYVIKNIKRSMPQIQVTRLEPQKILKYYAASGTSSAVTWNNLPLPYGLESIKFISGNFALKNDAIASGVESNTLPTTVDATSTLRHLWVRVTPKAGFTIEGGENYIDITVTSGIQSLA